MNIVPSTLALRVAADSGERSKFDRMPNRHAERAKILSGCAGVYCTQLAC
jgi:hypothetical protein